MSVSQQIRSVEGAVNLLKNCAGCEAGERVLIVHECGKSGYFCEKLKDHLSIAARGLGLFVTDLEVVFDPNVSELSSDLRIAVDNCDHVVFLARVGDQLRFKEHTQSAKLIVSYALDVDMLESDFGVADYNGFKILKGLVDDHLVTAKEIRVTCPLGTDFSGAGSNWVSGSTDTTVKRFPMSVFSPIPAGGFSGRIAQAGYLVGTGSQYYEPYACEITETLLVDFLGNQIVNFAGAQEDVEAAKVHYASVGSQLNIDPDFVHSWHIGIHPGCAYDKPAGQNLERWTGGAFGNPRLLHFHTCGAYAPGEISLNVLDPTVSVDGVEIWENGMFDPNLIPGGAEVLSQFPCIAQTFKQPAMNVGQSVDERLSFSAH